MQQNAAVIPFKRRRAKYRGLDLVPGLQVELMALHRSGKSFKSMSEECNGIPGSATISKIAYGDTKFPRFSTVIALYHMLGFTITAERD